MRYSPSILSVLYGILLEEGLYVPSRGTGNGFRFIVFGMLLLFFTFYMEYLEIKNIKHDNAIKETKELSDYFCALFGVFGLIFFGLFLFEIVTNYYIYIVVMLSFIYCGKSMRKFI